MIEYKYSPEYKDMSWMTEVKFDYKNLTTEQVVQAFNIIYFQEIVGTKGLYELLDRLAKAGFRGKIEHTTQLDLPLIIVIDSKIETTK